MELNGRIVELDESSVGAVRKLQASWRARRTRQTMQEVKDQFLRIACEIEDKNVSEVSLEDWLPDRLSSLFVPISGQLPKEEQVDSDSPGGDTVAISSETPSEQNEWDSQNVPHPVNVQLQDQECFEECVVVDSELSEQCTHAEKSADEPVSEGLGHPVEEKLSDEDVDQDNTKHRSNSVDATNILTVVEGHPVDVVQPVNLDPPVDHVDSDHPVDQVDMDHPVDVDHPVDMDPPVQEDYSVSSKNSQLSSLKGVPARTKEELLEERSRIAMELLWVQQAINSRKQYLQLREGY